MSEAVTSKTENERTADGGAILAPRQLGTDLVCMVLGIFAFGCTVYRAALFTRQSPPAITSHDPFFITVVGILALLVGHGSRRSVFPRPAAFEPSVLRVLGLSFVYLALAGVILSYLSEYGSEALARFYIRRYD